MGGRLANDRRHFYFTWKKKVLILVKRIKSIEK